jgi:hypothetical protein
MQVLFSFDRGMRVEKTLMQTLASQLSSILVRLLFFWPGNESWVKLSANSRFSTLINSHATLVLVWPGDESWENSHANSRFSTPINSYATLVLVSQNLKMCNKICLMPFSVTSCQLTFSWSI